MSILCQANPPIGPSTPNDPITWPFVVWGLDLVKPLKRAPRGYMHLLVTVDKFTKCIEARPISVIKSEQVVLFFLDIIHRFGSRTPSRTTVRSSPEKKFLQFCGEYHIRVDWAVVAHPRMNGQVEHANGMVLQGLKPRIFNRLNKFGA